MDANLLQRLDLEAATGTELSTRNRLLPRRWDDSILMSDVAGVVRWLRPQLRRGQESTAQDIVLVNKGWRGLRPLSVMSLADRIAYRALVDLLKAELPAHLREREPNAQFRRAPLDVVGTKYVLQTDVAAFFQFVDHELLADELLAQTGEEPAVGATISLLSGVAGRHVGIPQINSASDVLSDVYIDPVRRRLARAGFATFRYADDFRVSCPTLGSALKALEVCDGAVRDLGLVLNERKTLTYSRRNYELSLDAFKRREAELFAGEEADGDPSDLDEEYENDSSLDPEETLSQLTGAEPIAVDDEEALISDEDGLGDETRARLGRAASRVWGTWIQEDESHEVQSTQDAAITQSLLGRALPVLGSLGETAPLEDLEPLLRHEPALTPQIAAYLTRFAGSGPEAARSARDALDDVVSSDVLSPWQSMWLAHAAGMLPRRTGGRWPGKHIEWLLGSVESGPPALAATAAMALGRRRRGEAQILASALDRVGPEWRNLLFLGLALLDPGIAKSCSEGSLERILLAGAAAV